MGALHQQNTWTPTKRRGPISAEFTSPGPASVTLPTLFGGCNIRDSKKGRAPAFSFGSRHGNKGNTIGPGPGQYNVTGLSAKGKEAPHAPTLASRPRESKGFQTPAPGEYNPEKSDKLINQAPKYTFGVKTQAQRPSNTPAPGEYSPEKADVLNHTPKYSFGLKTQAQKPMDTPAPGEYNPEKADNLNQAPKYSFGLKTQPQKAFDTPAPGEYDPEKADNVFNHTPKYSFGLKTQAQKPFDTPAPGEYCPERADVLNHTPRYSFGVKTQPPKPMDTPAPNVYKIPGVLGSTKEGNKKQAPSFTISSRQKEPVDERVKNPGPGTYNESRLDNPAAHSFGIKHSPYLGYLKYHMQ